MQLLDLVGKKSDTFCPGKINGKIYKQVGIFGQSHLIALSLSDLTPS